MKLSLATLAIMCGAMVFSAENVKFNTKPDQKILTSGKAVSYFRIMPENLKEDKFYRVTLQIKLNQTDNLATRIYRGEKAAPGWNRTGRISAEWQPYCQYIAPGTAWSYYSIGVRTKGNAFLVKDIKVEALDEQDLTGNLLPPLKGAGWYNAWGKKEAKIEFEKSEDSPFGAEILTAEISEGTGYPATLAVPVVPGRTLVLSLWVKGEPDEIWLATVTGCCTKNFPVKNEWAKQEVKFQVNAKAPTVANLVFWKNKNKKQLKCSFGQVEAYYEK